MAKSKSASTNPLIDLIRSSPGQMQEAEKWIMLSLIHNYDFWLMCQERLCKDPETSKEIDDFYDVKHNVIFRGLRIYANLQGETDGKSDHTPTASSLQTVLKMQADQALLCTHEEIPEIVRLYDEYKADAKSGNDWVNSAKKIFNGWLSISRTKHIVTGAKDSTLDELIANAERQSDAVSTTQDEDIVLFGKHKRRVHPKNSISLTGFPFLSQKLGNFRYGNAYLFQAPTGGGKTVMACQLVHEFISQGLKGVMITTEQGFDELEPRFVAIACSINIGHKGLNQGVDEPLLQNDKSDPSLYTRFREWEAMANGMFVVYPWENDNSQSIHTDLEATIRKVTKLLGVPPQFVILDWIGGALGSDVEPENTRIAYQLAADAFAASAKKHKYIGCAFAQSIVNKHLFKLDASTLAECKTMHRKYCSLIGITAIENIDSKGQSTDRFGKPVDEDTQKANNSKLTRDLYQDEQFFDIAKARFGKPGRIQIKREFHFQRFKELKDVDSAP